MMYAHCGSDRLIEFTETLPRGQRLIAQGEETILRQAVAEGAVQYACGWRLPEGTPDEEADAITVIAETVALLSQEKAWNEKYPVGTAVIVETVTRKETRSGHKTTTKVNKRRTVGKAVVWSGEVMVPVRKTGKRLLVPMSSISIPGRVKQ